MQVIPIPPTAHIVDFSHYPVQFALAQEAKKHGEYLEAYKSISDKCLIILDNGAYELGSSIGTEELGDIAEKMQAHEIILPDIMFNGHKTYKATSIALDYYRSRFGDDFKYQGVPQGRNQSEWLECLKQIADLGVDVIGIPKDLDYWPGGRELYARVAAQFCDTIHLLGLNHLDECTWNIPQVKRIDSAQAFNSAFSLFAHGFDMSIPRPAHYFELLLSSEQLYVAKANMTYWANHANS